MENKKEIIIKIEGDKWTEAKNSAFNKANSKAKIDGFRPGKAPKEMFLKKYGNERLLFDAAEALFHDAYHMMLDESKGLEIVARPHGDIKAIEEDYVEYVFTLVLRPEVKLGKYTGFALEKTKVEVTDSEVEKELENLVSKYSEIVVKEGKVELNDITSIDFEGSKNGVLFDGGTSKDYSLTIGSKTFIPGFEEELIGMEKGETKSFDIKFPEDYHSEDLKGQMVTFKVTINEIKTKQLPELDKDFFEDLGMEGITDVDTLKKQLKENIEARKEQQLENEHLNKLFDLATKEMEVVIPEEMLEDEIDRIIDNYAQQLEMQGIKLEDYFKMTNSDEASLRTMVKEEADVRVKQRILLEEIIKLEKVVVNESEINEFIEDLAKKYQVENEEITKMYGGNEIIEYELKMRKAIDILKK